MGAVPAGRRKGLGGGWCLHISVNVLSAPDPYAQKWVKWSVWCCLCFLTMKQPSMWVVSGLSLLCRLTRRSFPGHLPPSVVLEGWGVWRAGWGHGLPWCPHRRQGRSEQLQCQLSVSPSCLPAPVKCYKIAWVYETPGAGGV